MVPNEEFHIFTIHFESLKRGQPLYKGQNAWLQGVVYIEVPLYVHLVTGFNYRQNVLHVCVIVQTSPLIVIIITTFRSTQ